MSDNNHSKLKRKIAIYTLIFVLAGAAARIAYVNITAEKPIIEYYSENEWAGLNGSSENCLHSEKIQSMPEEKGFAKYSADGKFDVAQTYGESLADSGVNQWSRYVQGRDYFGSQLTEGTDYDIITVKEKG